MIYLVTAQQKLFENPEYKTISIEESLQLLNSCEILQYDSETTGVNARLCNILCIQFGNKKKDFQIVVDTTTVDIIKYKEILENKLLVGQNLKFDLQFLYNYSIVPRKVYDTMIVEQLLYLGYPSGVISYSLAAIANRRLGIDIDKSIRGQIIWRGLDSEVILYAASDVTYLEDIMWSQVEECKKKECLVGAKLECDFVPVIAYLEWCGIKLDTNKWKTKMLKDNDNLLKSRDALNEYVHSILPKYFTINAQGSLFDGYSTTPICKISWDSPAQVVKLAKDLGFNTTVQDKKTGEDKDSVLEKTLKTQKGINDKFLDLYFKYKEYSKVVSTYGQGHLDAVNPKTGRIHTIYRQLGASSGRMSCGSRQTDEALAKLKKIPASRCTYPNIQQLPADEDTRSSFISEKYNLFCSCDFSAMESYLGADIYEDKAFQDEFLYGSKDTHSLFAWMVFRKECEDLGCTCVADIKSKAPQWRKAVKSVEFSYMFGAAAPTVAQSANCSVEKAQEYIDNLNKGFSGISSFAKKGSKFVRNNGYVLINKFTGHKMYWWDHNKWLERQKSFTPEFWEDYKLNHKGTGDKIAKMVKEHFQAASKWDRMTRNAPTQGTGACITKLSCIKLFNWIIDNNYFNIVKLVAIVHDEVCIEYPESLKNTDNKLVEFMEDASKEYCKFSKIPAEASVGTHWIH